MRSGDLFIATRITGPTHNFLGLDFTAGRQPYVRDHSEPDVVDSDLLTSIRTQVDAAIAESEFVELALVGIQFDSNDSPSETTYSALASAIITEIRSGAATPQFEPTWAPEELDPE